MLGGGGGLDCTSPHSLNPAIMGPTVESLSTRGVVLAKVVAVGPIIQDLPGTGFLLNKGTLACRR